VNCQEEPVHQGRIFRINPAIPVSGYGVDPGKSGRGLKYSETPLPPQCFIGSTHNVVRQPVTVSESLRFSREDSARYYSDFVPM